MNKKKEVKTQKRTKEVIAGITSVTLATTAAISQTMPAENLSKEKEIIQPFTTCNINETAPSKPEVDIEKFKKINAPFTPNDGWVLLDLDSVPNVVATLICQCACQQCAACSECSSCAQCASCSTCQLCSCSCMCYCYCSCSCQCYCYCNCPCACACSCSCSCSCHNNW